MTIFNLYIFTKRGTLLHYAEFFRPVSTLRSLGIEEDSKLMFGLLLSLKLLMNGMNPNPTPPLPLANSPDANGALPGFGPEQGFFRFSTDSYTLFHLEVPTGYKFVITGDSAAGDLRPSLWTLYETIFTSYAMKNICYIPGTPIKTVGFIAAVDSFVRSLPGFSPPSPQLQQQLQGQQIGRI